MPYAFARRRRREGNFTKSPLVRVWRYTAKQCHATWRETRGAEEGNVFLLGLSLFRLPPLPFIGPPRETNAVFQSSTDILCYLQGVFTRLVRLFLPTLPSGSTGFAPKIQLIWQNQEDCSFSHCEVWHGHSPSALSFLSLSVCLSSGRGMVESSLEALPVKHNRQQSVLACSVAGRPPSSTLMSPLSRLPFPSPLSGC